MHSEKVSAPDLLNAAAKHMQDRAATYDKPEGERSMLQTVAIFNLHHGTQLTEAQGWHFMQVLKDVRMFTGEKPHKDSIDDCIAYSALKGEALLRGACVVVELVNPTPDGDGWIEWGGGECPVPPKTKVNWRLRIIRNSRETDEIPCYAEDLSWRHRGISSDIIAYRLA